MSDTPAAPAQSPARRRKRLLWAGLILAAIAVGLTLWYLLIAQWRERTDNAYVQGNLVNLSAKVAGQIVFLANEEGDRVAAGETIARLATGDAERDLQEAKHTLALAASEILSRRAAVETARAELALRQSSHQLARQEYQRRTALAGTQAISEEEVDAARTRLEEASAELSKAERELTTAQVGAGAGSIETHPLIRTASERVRATVRNLNKHRIITPINGVVARRAVDIGEIVDAGTPMYSVLETGERWIEANFKENQLRHLRPGQPVTAIADLHGNALPLRGHVTHIGAGTGATFSVLPPQNATGNWIKIVQRVPVRIDFDPNQPNVMSLPIGGSMTVTVDTHDRQTALGDSVPNIGAVSANAVFEDLNVDAADIISEVLAPFQENRLN
jgi:membrane fusion protein (multidrug efflux system)